MIAIITCIIACDKPTKPTINQRIIEQSSVSNTYTNRALTQLSIDDKEWLSTNYNQLDTDTFLYRQFFEKSLTLVHNEANILPIKNIADKRFKVVYWGEFPVTFIERLAYYCQYEFSAIEDFEWKTVTKSDQIVLVLNQKKLSKESFELLEQIHHYRKQIVIVNFEEVQNLLFHTDFPTIVQAYESNAVTQDWAAQLLFGGIQAKGQLPITLSDDFPKGMKNTETPIIRFSYQLPEAVGMDSKQLTDIDKIMSRAIRKKAIPGGQVIAIKSGKVVYYQSFGHFTYNKSQSVHNLNLYDLASVTKTSATTLAMMKLYDDNLLDTEKQLKDYLSKRAKSPSRNLKIRHLLTHRTGLPPNASIGKYVRIKDTVSTAYRAYFASQTSDKYSVRIAENRFMDKSIQDDLWNSIYQIRPARRRGYLYSDVNFAILQNVTETIAGEAMDSYLDRYIYQQLGLSYLRFNPLRGISKSMIVPTILDKKWRHKLLQGEVHDELAALLGGVGGNAGLFSNANDLAIIYQMLLNNGHYGGEQIFDKATIDHFIYKKYNGHRALGFNRKGTGCYKGASKQTFGHSGYTGTCVWVDPEKELIYVFLSNRVHPNPKNDKLIKLNTRTLIHRVFYKAM
ncbi:MAG: serine hydrolase domain-containing protein [Saprospiraceae bacterium]